MALNPRGPLASRYGFGAGAADRAAVGKVAQHGQTLLDDRMRLLALDMGDEAYAAGVVLIVRVI